MGAEVLELALAFFDATERLDLALPLCCRYNGRRAASKVHARKAGAEAGVLIGQHGSDLRASFSLAILATWLCKWCRLCEP